ncbi:unnamed protein product [Nezara viridula]|uniref:Cytochrome P450 n=1 Tax=Nezara viridula TaxID=85310 RepID=A0A9P0H5A9_NEZVI|nr:unnamed protein product [Nezara viridula]
MALVTNDWRIDVLMGIFTLSFLIYYKIKSIYSYFEKRNIKHVKGKFLLGSDPDMVFFKVHFTESWEKIYKKLENEKYGGFYQAIVPSIMLRDPEYINFVLKTKFEHFYDRNFMVDEKRNPLDENLFFLRGNKWKYLRSKMTPLFSQVKLKWMYEQIVECADIFDECIDKLRDGNDVDLNTLLKNFTADVTASCGFGIEPQALKNPDWEFSDIGREFFDPNKMNMLIILLRFSIPHVFYWLKLGTVTNKVRHFFLSTTEKILHQRRSTGVVRKDFVQLLLQLKEKGTVEIDSRETEKNKVDTETSNEVIELTDNLLAAQSFAFFLAGYETTSTTLYFTCYLLAKHPEIQERARKEVQEIKAKYGQFTFESLKELKYLNYCILESMRMYPAVPSVIRECTKDCTLPDGAVIEKGITIIVPIMSIHLDPNNYPEPMKYKPERFENPPASGTYLPFGDGPRYCIGKRFAEVVMLCIMARTLEKYKLESSTRDKNGDDIKLQPRGFTANPINGLWIRINKLNDSK